MSLRRVCNSSACQAARMVDQAKLPITTFIWNFSAKHRILNFISIGFQSISSIIIYKEMFLGCDWLIRVQLIPNITQNSAKICNTVQKSVTTVQKSATTVQKSVTTVQKSVISSLSDGIYSLKNQKYGGRIFTFA